MPAYKYENDSSWYVVTQYTDWTGARKSKCKRGFKTKKEALAWERVFHQQTAGDLEMPFDAFVDLYCQDIKPRIKENTWLTKEHIITKKILPYFKKRKLMKLQQKMSLNGKMNCLHFEMKIDNHILKLI